MSKKHQRKTASKSSPIVTSVFDTSEPYKVSATASNGATIFFRGRVWLLGVIAAFVLLTVGVFAKNGWFPSTDPLSGKRTGWFGKPIAKNAPSSYNPFSPPPTPTPVSLSKEYIYVGSRLLAVEDANANAAPPADLAVWRPSSGVWYVLGGYIGSSQTTQTWGVSGDVPVPGDYDGDGKTDFAVMRPGTTANQWWIIYSSSGAMVDFYFGVSGDIAAAADFDGDGKSDAAVFTPSNGIWYIRGSQVGTYTQTWGQSGDIPGPADFDGDGKADIAVWRSSNSSYYSINSTNSAGNTITFSQTGDKPVSGDYDGDGRADYAIWKDSIAYWYIRKSSDAQVLSINSGVSGDVPVQNDYDADGKVDVAVWRGSTGYWHITQSTDNQLRSVHWGQAGDIPVPAYYRR